MSRLDARDVEHFVDELEQMLTAAQDLVDALLPFFGEVRLVEQLREAEDRVERRPQVVAHAREEIALRAVRALRLETRNLERIVGLLALGDVDRDRAERVCGARVVQQREFNRMTDARALRQEKRFLALDELIPSEHFFVVGAVHVGKARRKQILIGAAGNRGRGQTCRTLELAADHDVPPTRVLQRDHRGAVIENCPQPPLRLRQRLGPLHDAALELGVQPPDVFLGAAALHALGRFRKRAPHRRRQARHPILQDVVGRAFLQALHGELLADAAGQKDEGDVGTDARRDHLRGEAVERGQIVIAEDGVEPARSQRGLERFTAIDARDPRLEAASRQRRLDEVGVVLVVFEMQDRERAHAAALPLGGVSLTTAQKPPSSFTASMNS